MAADPAKVPLHVELDTPGGIVYALIEDWRSHADEAARKVLTLQPASGSGEPGGQPCVPTRHRLAAPEVERLLRHYPELEPMVTEARLVQPEPAAPPSVADLSRQVAELTALLLGQKAPTPAPAPDVVAQAAAAAAAQVLAELRASVAPTAPPPRT
jgi:hypothetical protein